MDTCSNCPKRAECREICDLVESQLPKMWAGRDWPFSEPDAQARIERLLIGRIVMRHLTSRRDALTAAQREVFDLYYNEGLSQSRIAESLGLHRNTVDEHLRRARERIARQFAAEGDPHLAGLIRDAHDDGEALP